MRPPELVRQITELLQQGGVTLSSFDAEKGMWIMPFDVEGKRQMASVYLPDEPTYLFLVSTPASTRLQGHSLDDLPADVLRTIIRVQTDVPLARLIYVAAETYFVVSECSVEGLSDSKIRVRLESVARMAAKLDVALA